VNAPLRKVGIVVLALFALLFINLNWIQAYKADDYRTSQYNGRVLISDYERQRGVIADAHGVVLARSVATDDNLKYLRKYPLGAAFAPVTGYRPVQLGATGVEQAENDYLAGNSDSQALDRFWDLFSDTKKPGGNVYTTIDKNVQQTAYNALLHNDAGVKEGAAVVIDPSTGKILALASTPGYDPNPLASHNDNDALKAYNAYNKAADNPLVNHAISDTYPPGSTFKVIDSAAALSTGQYTTSTVIPAGRSYTPIPGGGFTMKNDAPGVCPGANITLIDALTVSCNTAFAQLGVKLGSAALRQQAQAFGFGDASLTLANGSMPVAASQTGSMLNASGNDDPNHVAQSSIGQYEVRMTPLQGALIAAAVANGGVEMRPYLIDHTQGPDLSIDYQAQPQALRTPVSAQVAGELQTMMISVVEHGTGERAQVNGYDVGGKTGTAQNTASGDAHGWFIGFAMKDGKPIAAVSVLLKNAGSSKYAAGVAGDILKAAIQAQGGK
jgi:penicillin-binding protein A